MLTALLTGITVTGSACPFCNKEILKGIYDSQFYPNLLTMLSAFIVLAVIVVILVTIAAKNHRSRLAANPGVQILSPVPLTTASMVLGIGLGGFMDGIVLHQVLQVHEMLSNKIPATTYTGKSINMFWDGIFHFFCMLVVLAGIILMWKLLSGKGDIDRSGKLFGGGLLLGWGLFNIVEGLIDHQLLKLHNVIEFSANHNTGNFIFLGVSVMMLVIGYVLVTRKHQHR
ncbi:Uncharacterized membrane protein [Chitinophaga rupis]|uniref:Uncharacterized membrane protein n=1 Tax=Chitinophaga rupis TaxID=573321 RepID=A0A1H7ZLG3_9BACT|nr:Uncharacterized membrane protein [Chitinophaga rupis]